MTYFPFLNVLLLRTDEGVFLRRFPCSARNSVRLGFCAIRAFRVKNEFYHFSAEILNTEYTDVYCKGITRST